MDLARMAEWLSRTPLSLAIQTHGWVIPAVQSVHIVAIGILLSSVFMMARRVLGPAGHDQTVGEVERRFGPWLSGSLWVLLATGVLMVIGEPPRELLALSFWIKMGLVATGAIIVGTFRRSVAGARERWDATLVHQPAIRALTVLTVLLWMAVVVLGRFIAYDHVWGAWSLGPGA